MIFVLKKRYIIAVSVVLIALAAATGVAALVHALTPKPEYTVVLDAGHGGIDGGVIGVNSKVPESEINLTITRKVQKLLKNQGIEVVLTRSTSDGLYGAATDGYKRRDMAERKRIINKASPDLVVSIHCNKFPSASRRGAQVFFEPLSDNSVLLAESLQNSLNSLNSREINRTFSSLKGDYYILKCSRFPSAIVECGFLSNPEDDLLLNNDSYQDEVAYSIFSGIISYLTQKAAV